MTGAATTAALRGYQAEAVAAITASSQEAGGRRRIWRAAPGKTLVAASVAARLAGSGITIVLAPSIALVAQAIGAWGAGCPVDRVLAVCRPDRREQLGIPRRTGSASID